MSNLTYDQHCERDIIVLSTIQNIVWAVKYDKGKMDVHDEGSFNFRVSHLSDEARRQVTEEVRQVLLLLEKLNKKRVM
jgi:hypothetical protein